MASMAFLHSLVTSGDWHAGHGDVPRFPLLFFALVLQAHDPSTLSRQDQRVAHAQKDSRVLLMPDTCSSLVYLFSKGSKAKAEMGDCLGKVQFPFNHTSQSD